MNGAMQSLLAKRIGAMVGYAKGNKKPVTQGNWSMLTTRQCEATNGV